MKPLRQEILNTTVTGTNSYESEIFQVQQFKIASLQFIWTGTPTGTLTIQLSNDGTNWDDLDIDLVNPAGGAGNHLAIIHSNALAAEYIRAKYVNASGSGVLVVKLVAKGEE